MLAPLRVGVHVQEAAFHGEPGGESPRVREAGPLEDGGAVSGRVGDVGGEGAISRETAKRLLEDRRAGLDEVRMQVKVDVERLGEGEIVGYGDQPAGDGAGFRA